MRRNTIDIPKETLEHFYWDERLSMKAIAAKLGLSITPVYRSMERHNIKRRTDLEIKRLERGRLKVSREQLEDYYLRQCLPIVYIAQQLGISDKTVHKLLGDFEIPIRTRSEVQKISAPKRLRDKDGHGRNWRGGRTRNGQGYVLIYAPEHPRRNESGYVYEHILVWEKVHGNPLPKKMAVHHLNGIKDDNRPENLKALTRGEHASLAKPYQERIRQLEVQIQELQTLKSNI